MIDTPPGNAKYSSTRQRYIEALQCSVIGCTWPHRYPTASGALFCTVHWRHYIAVKVEQYLHQQAMLDAMRQRQDFDEIKLKQRVVGVLAMGSDEITMFLVMHSDIVALVDDINEVK